MNFNTENELARLGEKRVSTEDIFDGVILHVKRDMVELSNGSETVREVIRHIGAVCVIPVTDDNKVIMERQFRYPLNKVILEIPAGKLDAPDEDRLSAIKRELREETGYVSDDWTPLLTIPSSATISDNYAWLFAARNCRKVTEQDLDPMELLRIQTYSAEEIDKMLANGGFQQSVHALAWLLYKQQA